jgi:hypothetical protein
VIQITHGSIGFSDNPSRSLQRKLPGLAPLPQSEQTTDTRDKLSLDVDGRRQKVEGMRHADQNRKLPVGVMMNAVSVLRTRTVNSKACDQEAQKQNHVERECRPISLLSVLEAENIRLRRAVVELLVDTLALREALHGREDSARRIRSKSLIVGSAEE